VVGCSRCDRPISTQVLKTLEQIVSLPDAIGSHACECGSEVLPFSASEMRSESEPVSEAYRCGWAEGLLGNTETFVHNGGLARWEDAHNRLDYYRGHRAGRAVRS
jgi:hypothetical protein